MKKIKIWLVPLLRGFLCVIFLLIIWFRPVVKMVFDLMSGLTFFGAILYGVLSAFSGSVHWGMVLPMLVMSFALFLLSWLFDSMALAISPEGFWLFD